MKKDMSISALNTATAMFLFQITPGDITFFNLTPSEKNRLRMIAKNDFIENAELFSEINVPHFFLKIDKDVREFLTDYSMLGGTHHFAMVYGDLIEDIRILSEISGIEFFKI